LEGKLADKKQAVKEEKKGDVKLQISVGAKANQMEVSQAQ